MTASDSALTGPYGRVIELGKLAKGIQEQIETRRRR
jgi:hypothetical protein